MATGIEKLVLLQGQMAKIANGKHASFVRSRIDKEILSLIDRGFRQSKDPYGSPWEKLKPATIKRKGNSRILQGETGDLRSGFKVKDTPKGFKIINETPYAVFHQSEEARKIIPRRAMIPDSRGLPSEWARLLSLKVSTALKEYIRGRR
jgi:hypothetical protein